MKEIVLGVIGAIIVIILVVCFLISNKYCSDAGGRLMRGVASPVYECVK